MRLSIKQIDFFKYYILNDFNWFFLYTKMDTSALNVWLSTIIIIIIVIILPLICKHNDIVSYIAHFSSKTFKTIVDWSFVNKTPKTLFLLNIWKHFRLISQIILIANGFSISNYYHINII